MTANVTNMRVNMDDMTANMDNDTVDCPVYGENSAYVVEWVSLVADANNAPVTNILAPRPSPFLSFFVITFFFASAKCPFHPAPERCRQQKESRFGSSKKPILRGC